MSALEVQPCQECGASIYPEHLQNHKAGYWGGKLCCVHCYSTHRQQAITPRDTPHSPPAAPHAAVSLPSAASGPAAGLLEDLEGHGAEGAEEQPIVLSGLTAPGIESAAHAASAFPVSRRIVEAEARQRRPAPATGRGATRCRIFHAKLNDGALRFMQDQINEWIEQHPDVEIKHASTQVGIVEGKSQEPHLIITLFY